MRELILSRVRQLTQGHTSNQEWEQALNWCLSASKPHSLVLPSYLVPTTADCGNNAPGLWSSQCGPQTSSINWFSISVLKEQILQPHPELLNQKLWGWDPGSDLCLNQRSWWAWCTETLRTSARGQLFSRGLAEGPLTLQLLVSKPLFFKHERQS